MTFEIEISGRIRRVSVERVGEAGAYRVILDGQAHTVNVHRAGDFTLSLLVERGTATVSSSQKLPTLTASVAESDRAGRGTVPLPAEKTVAVPLSREVVVAPGTTRGEMLVTLEGRTVAAIVNGRRTGGAAAEAGSQAHGEQAVVAPMPGRVVRVLVQPGDSVDVRQGVVVVEAMKMENELRAPKAGRVKDVQVSAGASVEAGRVLIVIE